jgi:hypothetical protein
MMKKIVYSFIVSSFFMGFQSLADWTHKSTTSMTVTKTSGPLETKIVLRLKSTGEPIAIVHEDGKDGPLSEITITLLKENRWDFDELVFITAPGIEYRKMRLPGNLDRHIPSTFLAIEHLLEAAVTNKPNGTLQRFSKSSFDCRFLYEIPTEQAIDPLEESSYGIDLYNLVIKHIENPKFLFKPIKKTWAQRYTQLKNELYDLRKLLFG